MVHKPRMYAAIEMNIELVDIPENDSSSILIDKELNIGQQRLHFLWGIRVLVVDFKLKSSECRQRGGTDKVGVKSSAPEDERR
jgi:hypothetical protein